MPTVNVPCPTCQNNIRLRLRGTVRDAERYAEWKIENGLVCAECAQEKIEKENEEAAKANAEMDLPPLTGSEKQKAWAESIRLKKADVLTTFYDLFACKSVEEYMQKPKHIYFLNSDIALSISKDFDLKNRDDWGKIAQIGIRFADLMLSKTRAAWWIDNRNVRLERLLVEFKDELLVDRSENDDLLEKEIKTECTVQPENTVTKTVAEISFDNKKVRVITEQRVDAIIEAVKSRGYKWTGEVWQLDINVIEGSALDRAAEIINALLNAGVPICCVDDKARDKGVNASFEPKYPRWISKVIGGKYKDRLLVDMECELDEIKHLPSAWQSYKTGKWYLRASEWAAIRDFAERHQFRISDGAEEALATAQEEEESRLLVSNVAKPDSIDIETIPDDTSVPGEIDPDLRDE